MWCRLIISREGSSVMKKMAVAAALAIVAQGCTPSSPSGPDARTLVRQLDAAVPAAIADECLSRDAAVGDSALQLTTQLMVTSLTCEEAYADSTLYARYREFVATQADVLRDAQTSMIRHYRRFGDGEALFDAYRTDLANTEAQLVLDQTPGRYCAARRSRFDSLVGAAPVNFATYAEEVARRQLVSEGCTGRR